MASNDFILQSVNLVPAGLLRAVVNSNGQVARKMTIPAKWISHHLYPRSVYVVLGNLLIISTEDDSALADRAAEILTREGVMEALPPAGMEEV